MKPTDDNRLRVLRGGGWLNFDATLVRAAHRSWIAPAFRDDFLSFRCAQRGCRQQVLKGMTPP